MDFESALRKTAKVCCLAMPLIYLAASLIYLHDGWDDGAITLAYARTYLHTGLFALTPVSPVAEGSSSLLWTLLTGLASVAAPSAASLLAISKIFSAISFLAFLFLFRRFAGIFLADTYRDLATIIMALSVTPVAEIANGMEMNLYAVMALYLAVLWLQEKVMIYSVFVLCSVLSLLILAIRFESPFLLFFLFVGLWFARPENRRWIYGVIFVDACGFALMELWRWRTFQSIVPNTIIAKRWPPYTDPSLLYQTYRHILGLFELSIVFVGPVAILLLLYLGRMRKDDSTRLEDNPALRSQGNLSLLVIMSASALLFGLLLGKNWGAIGRMAFAFSPFFVVLLFVGISRMMQGRRSPAPLFGAILGLQALALIAQFPRSVRNIIPEARMQSRGDDLEQMRLALNLPTLTVMISDVGGVALCCEKLRVLDTGLLTNQALAHAGYSAIPAMIAAEHPDAIETHAAWQEYGEFYRKSLLAEYEPVLFDDMIVYVRIPLASRLVQSPHFVAASCRESFNVQFPKPDTDYMREQPHCIRWIAPVPGT